MRKRRLVVLVPLALVLSGCASLVSGDTAGNDRAAEIVTPREWRERVNAICRWERKEFRKYAKAFGRPQTPADAEALISGYMSIGKRSTAIFRRLEANPGDRRPKRNLLAIVAREHRVLERMIDAVQTLDSRLYARQWPKLVRLERRKTRVLRRLGVDDCLPKKFPEPEARRLLV